MLDGTRDAHRNVELRRDNLAGLPDLIVVRHIARIHRCTRSTQRSAELVGQRFKQLLVGFAAAHAATTGDDNLGRAEFGTFGLGQLALDQRGATRAATRVDVFHCGAATGGGNRFKGCGTHGDDLDGITALHRRQHAAGVNRAHEGVRRFDANDVADLRHIQQGSDTRQNVFAVGAGRCENVRIAGSIGDDDRRDVFRRLRVQMRGVRHTHLGDTGDGSRRLRRSRAAGTGNEDVNLTANLGSSGNGVERSRLDGLVIVFSQNQDCHIRSPLLRFSVSRPARPHLPR